MKYMEKILETGTLRMDDALAPAPISTPTPVFALARASVPASTDANKIFASIVKMTQPIIEEPSDDNVDAESKEEKMSRANDASKKVNFRNAKMTNQGTLVVEVSSENDRESAVTRLKLGFSGSYVVDGAKMLPSKFIVVGIRSDVSEDEIINVICEKDGQLNQLVGLGKTLKMVNAGI